MTIFAKQAKIVISLSRPCLFFCFYWPLHLENRQNIFEIVTMYVM